ncbi:methyltransferase domain-containing protein [Streptomyces sp. NPDC018833]|uniref:methyltransferase domain-containing protein n=1 Tax=Streptomyces sp. NPDC018833 TaxID=3365053 RepID=UPI00379D146D
MADISKDLFGPFAGIGALNLPNTRLVEPFDGILGMFYTKIVNQAEQDSAWFAEQAVPAGPGKVLDLCCGGGRSAVELARAGHEVTAVDISPIQLAATQKRAAEFGVTDRMTFVRADVTTLDLDQVFDAVVIGGLSVTLFDGDARTALLRTVARHLAPSGRLLFDHTPAQPGEQESEKVFAVPIKLRERSGFVLVGTLRQPASRTQFTNMSAELTDEEGRTTRHLTGFRFWIDSTESVTEELGRHGLTVVAAHQDPEGRTEHQSPATMRELVVAERVR